MCFSLSSSPLKAWCSIFDKRINFLIDTGCQLNLIDSKVVKNLKLEKSFVKLISANGSHMKVLGALKNMPLIYDNKKYHISLIVIEDLSVQGILGCEFLSKNNFTVSLNNHKSLIVDCNIIKSQEVSEVTHSIDTGMHNPISVPQYR